MIHRYFIARRYRLTSQLVQEQPDECLLTHSFSFKIQLQMLWQKNYLALGLLGVLLLSATADDSVHIQSSTKYGQKITSTTLKWLPVARYNPSESKEIVIGGFEIVPPNASEGARFLNSIVSLRTMCCYAPHVPSCMQHCARETRIVINIEILILIRIASWTKIHLEMFDSRAFQVSTGVFILSIRTDDDESSSHCN